MNHIVGLFDRTGVEPRAEQSLGTRRGPQWDRVDRFTDRFADIAVGTYATSSRDVGCAGLLVDTESPIVFAFDGFLGAREELQQWLGPLGEASQPEIALRAFKRFGEATATMLTGDFAFVAYNRETQQVVASVDPFATRPLHRGRHDAAHCFASSQRAVRAALAQPLRADADSLAAMLFYELVTRERSLYEGVKTLSPGSTVVMHRATERTDSYFQFEPGEDRWLPLRAHLDCVTSSLEEATRDRLAEVERVGILASGGLDSTVVAALVARECRRRGSPPPVLFHFRARGFVADEFPYARQLAEYLDLELLSFERDTPFLPGNPLHDFSQPSSAAHQAMFQAALRQGIRVLFTGQGSDELQWRNGREVDGALSEGHWLQAARFAGLGQHPFAPSSYRRFAGAIVRALTPRARYREKARRRFAARLPEWLTPRGRAAVLAAHDDWANAEAALSHPNAARRTLCTELVWSTAMTFGHQGEFSFAAENGIELRHPFMDARVAAAFLTVPTSFLLAPQVIKPFTRKIAAQLVPDELAYRPPPSDYSGMISSAWDQAEAWIRALEENGRLFELEIVDRDKLIGALRSKSPDSFSFPEMACLQAEDWLNGLSPIRTPLFL